MKAIKSIGLVLAAMVLVNASYAQKEKTVDVGGAAMYPSKNIVENAVNSSDHTTLVAAVKAAGLVDKRLANMALVRLGRLSVQPVTDDEWKIIMEMAGEK